MMTDLIQAMLSRHSIRQYTDEPLQEEHLQMILLAGMCAPSSRNLKSGHMIVVKDKTMLEKLSQAKTAGGQMLKNAACAIVVYGDASASDAWIEDCSLMMGQMHLAADDMGVGSCWVQIRNRHNASESADATIKRLLSLKETDCVEAILSLGYPVKKQPAYEVDQFELNSIKVI
ncbi:MAG: nitroreductase family protein [Erysipelotrichaceae bacterium]|nr:nitroreductase family protein [Erysipelotrichaceae bacterium]